MDPYATHVPVLAWALQETRHSELPILELGCGDYSTPMLAHSARVHVCSTDPEWSGRYLQWPNVIVHKLHTWDEFFINQRYRMAFLDNEQHVKDRVKMLDMLLDYADIVVMHDWRSNLTPPPTAKSGIYTALEPYTWWGMR